MSLKDILGSSPPMRALRALIAQVAPTDISVLISGESGTGKELVAQSIHDLSPRRGKPLLVVNCGAIPEGIFESEVFGHERGSYTGADKQRIGYFEQADGGSLMLDEIAEMPLAAQVKLLRILEQGEFMRVGSSRTLRVNVRIMAATNVDLATAVARGNFRQDLYFRLKAVQIVVPPLRERTEDIPTLAERFIRLFCERNQLSVPTVSGEAYQFLMDQYWSGNVRELRNTLESVLTLERGAAELTAAHFRAHIQPVSNPSLLPVQVNRPPEQLERELLFHILMEMRKEVSEIKAMLGAAISQAQSIQPASTAKLDEMEREQILRTLDEHGGNRRKTARVLGIGERTLYRKLKEYHLE
jgi:DNA-binding NtrC family response regulator